MLIESLRKWTEPSAKAKLAPPEWLLPKAPLVRKDDVAGGAQGLLLIAAWVVRNADAKRWQTAHALYRPALPIRLRLACGGGQFVVRGAPGPGPNPGGPGPRGPRQKGFSRGGGGIRQTGPWPGAGRRRRRRWSRP